MLAFVLYDAILTLHGESQVVWKALKTKISPQIVLYLICKYGALLDAALLAVGEYPSSDCLALELTRTGFTSIGSAG